ncbi:MAG: hypothetical protein HW414_1586 [Dehalococcoidia bacterium]|nr:hypothetical protein [Dehalococcoidia bacterium]
METTIIDKTRWQQEFYSQVEPIRLKDPLASFLGAIAPDGVMFYRFEDAVKLAGHSCPAVATAYKMTAKALARLYPNETPVRGEINVVVPGGPGDGALGPMSQVIALITGAAAGERLQGPGRTFPPLREAEVQRERQRRFYLPEVRHRQDGGDNSTHRPAAPG